MDSRLNDRTAQAAAAAGVHFFDVEEHFSGHEICGDEGEWINYIARPSELFEGKLIDAGSFHPTREGQFQYAVAFQAGIDELLAPGAPTLATGLPANPGPAAASSMQSASVAASGETQLPEAPAGSVGPLSLEPVAAHPASACDRVFNPGEQVLLRAASFAPASPVTVRMEMPDAGFAADLAVAVAGLDGVLETVVMLPASAPTPFVAGIYAQGVRADGGAHLALESAGIASPLPECDTAPPSIQIQSPPEGATYGLGEVVTAGYACQDEGSGVSECLGPVASGEAIDTSATGTHTFNVSAWDREGNYAEVTRTYRVVYYQFEGFFSPVDNPPVRNVVKAGQTIPLKWRLTDEQGSPVADGSSFVSVTVTQIACDDSSPSDAVEEVTSSSGLEYLGDGFWQLNWKSPKSYAGSCRVVKLNLADHVDEGRSAIFDFRS